MKHLSLTLLLLTSHLPLYLMDDDKDIQLDDKSVRKILACIKECKTVQDQTKWEDISTNMCTSVCTTLYTSRVKEKLQKEQTQALLARAPQQSTKAKDKLQEEQILTLSQQQALVAQALQNSLENNPKIKGLIKNHDTAY